jgi:hypothetical protein
MFLEQGPASNAAGPSRGQLYKRREQLAVFVLKTIFGMAACVSRKTPVNIGTNSQKQPTPLPPAEAVKL